MGTKPIWCPVGDPGRLKNSDELPVNCRPLDEEGLHAGQKLRQVWLLCAIEDVDSPVMALPLHTLQQLDLAAGGRHSAASPLLAGAD